MAHEKIRDDPVWMDDDIVAALAAFTAADVDFRFLEEFRAVIAGPASLFNKIFIFIEILPVYYTGRLRCYVHKKASKDCK